MEISLAEPLAPLEDDRMRQAAELLLAARRTGDTIDDLPPELQPHSLREAYAVQDTMAEALGAIGGWKVGAPSPDATPVFGPMPLLGKFTASGEILPGHVRRLRGVEGEIAYQLGRDLPPRERPYSRTEIVDAIASAHPVIEVLESAFTDPDKVDRFTMIADLQINGGFVYGAAFPEWQSFDFATESIVVTVDGVIRFEGTASNMAGTDLLHLVTYLANEGSARTGGLQAGQWVTTGSWSGKTPASAGSIAVARFTHFGEVWARFA